ncbi:hypothetical protein RDWZM_010164 [Blomia tropicalis]|uniref:Ig-like domain-containing protein n=1 Tax=Blomia tropicalis TaxID=40697 RepID=A0A9Q0RIF1_BLOTA|nr:hypothetical protein RDWZM_010164 [Blomia tropicalis]
MSCTLVILLISAIQCQQNPTISFITKERITSIGDTLDISCSVQYAKNYPVIWAKFDPDNPRNTLFISKGASLSIPDNRYSVRHDDASSTYTLQITKIQEVDAGIYQCMVVIPQVHALLPGTVLIMHNVTKQDRGEYYCFADNGVGSGAKRRVEVEVEFAPEVEVKISQYRQALRYHVDLFCTVQSYPSSTIRWFKDGVEIQDSRNYQISIFQASKEYIDSTLRVMRIERKHYGIYTCKATNKLGSGQKLIELIESVDPVCPPACDGYEPRFGADNDKGDDDYYGVASGRNQTRNDSRSIAELPLLPTLLAILFAIINLNHLLMMNP